MGFVVTESAKKNQKGIINARQGALGTNRAISLLYQISIRCWVSLPHPNLQKSLILLQLL